MVRWSGIQLFCSLSSLDSWAPLFTKTIGSLQDRVVFIGSGKLGFPVEGLLAFAMGCDRLHKATVDWVRWSAGVLLLVVGSGLASGLCRLDRRMAERQRSSPGPIAAAERRRAPLIFHPWLLSLFPCLFLYAQNFGDVRLGDIVSTSVWILIGTSALCGLLYLFLRDWEKAGLLASVFTLLFFSLGHLRSTLSKIPALAQATWTSPEVLALGLFLLLALGTAWLVTKREISPQLTSFGNSIALILVLLQLVQISWLAWKFETGSSKPEPEVVAGAHTPHNLPDIFYIVLDAYAGPEVLREIYRWNNEPFLAGLEARGFRVFRKSRSAYLHTPLSIASVLNLTNIHERIQFDATSKTLLPVVEHVWESDTIKTLRELGYSLTAVESGYSTMGRLPSPIIAKYVTLPFSLPEFQSALLASTPMPSLFSKPPIEELHRRRISNTLATLMKDEPSSQPKFVYAHLLSPHPPFVFDADGGPRESTTAFTMLDGPVLFRTGLTRREYKQGYRSQVQFISTHIEEIVDRLLSTRPPPVIILQGDHGPKMQTNFVQLERNNHKESFSTLFAIHLPGADLLELDDDLSIVNTFRLIFNELLGAELSLLPPRSFFSTFGKPLHFHEIETQTDAVQYDEIHDPLFLSEAGTTVTFGKAVQAETMTVELENNTPYEVDFFSGVRHAGGVSLDARLGAFGRALERTIEIPAGVGHFDRVKIEPKKKNRFYRLGRVRVPADAKFDTTLHTQ